MVLTGECICPICELNMAIVSILAISTPNRSTGRSEYMRARCVDTGPIFKRAMRDYFASTTLLTFANLTLPVSSVTLKRAK